MVCPLGVDADQCPTGYYCPEQTAEPVPCPAGTFNPSLALQAENQCLNCTGGSHCNETGDLIGGYSHSYQKSHQDHNMIVIFILYFSSNHVHALITMCL